MGIDVKKRGNDKIEAVAVLGEQQNAVGPRGEGPRGAASQESTVYTGGSHPAQPRKDEVRSVGVTGEPGEGRRARGKGQVK